MFCRYPFIAGRRGAPSPRPFRAKSGNAAMCGNRLDSVWVLGDNHLLLKPVFLPSLLPISQ
jgi:hypothetical protein